MCIWLFIITHFCFLLVQSPGLLGFYILLYIYIYNWYSRCSTLALGEQSINQSLTVRLLLWTMTTLVSLFSAVMLRFACLMFIWSFLSCDEFSSYLYLRHCPNDWLCREIYIQLKWTPAQVPCLGLTVVELVVSENLQSQLCSTEPSLFWQEVLCFSHSVKMEACLSSGMFGILFFLLSILISKILIKRKFGILFCSVETQGYLTLRCSLKLASRQHSIRASFCPLLSLEKGEYIG